MIIDTLYHWSPTENRPSIQKDGLTIGNNCINYPDYRANYVCLATTPWRGWGLLPVDPIETEIEQWDLWQVEIDNNDKIKIRSDLGTTLQEIRVFNTISANKVWLVGSREV